MFVERMPLGLRTAFFQLSKRLIRTAHETVATNPVGGGESSPFSQPISGETVTKAIPPPPFQPAPTEAVKHTYVNGNYPRDPLLLMVLTGLGLGGLATASGLAIYVHFWASTLQREIDQRFTATDQRFTTLQREIDQRFTAQEETNKARFAAINEKFATQEKHAKALESAIADLKQEQEKGFAEVKQLFANKR